MYVQKDFMLKFGACELCISTYIYIDLSFYPYICMYTHTRKHETNFQTSKTLVTPCVSA